MTLQQIADTVATGPAAALRGDWFVGVLIGYAVLYLFRFFGPLLEYAAAGSFDADLHRLETLVARDAEQRGGAGAEEERLEALARQLDEAQEALSQAHLLATVAEGAGELGDLARLRNGEIPPLEQRVRQLQEEMRAVQLTVRRGATSRLENLESLRATYAHPLVQESVRQIAAQYPQSQYQRFELTLLPSFGAYSERLSTARGMAGVFVLLGLLGTMIKLNDVVAGISEFTRSSRMAGSEFLAQMGSLMQDIGGAFSNSIWGVVLMVSMLVLISHVNAGVQRRIGRLDSVVSQKVVPALAEIHNRHLPEFTLADILRSTGDQLGSLDRTVVGLTRGMDQALSGLGTRIGEMLQQFGSYQKQYKQLNDWVGTLDTASAQLNRAAGELGRASARVGQPIDDMNRVLQEHLRAQAAFQASGHLERLLAEVRESLEAGRREQEALAAQSMRVSEEALRRAAAAAEALSSGAQAQHRTVEHELREVAAALRASSGKQIGHAVARLNATTEQIAARLDHSAAAFERASGNLSAYGRAPTFFFWLTQVAWPALVRRVRGRRADRRGPPRARGASSAGVRLSRPLDPDPVPDPTSGAGG
jgi:ABC-type transporter Mla subunit MlaD